MKDNDSSSLQSDFAAASAVYRKRALRRFGSVALLLLVFGAARVPLETAMTREHRAASFGAVQMNLGMRERVSQLGFLAALSGFRSLVAVVLWIEAHTAWEHVEYGRMKLIFDTVTSLAPRNVNYWDMSSWHMAYNASNYVMDDRKQPSLIRRRKAQREYFMLGKDYAERGIVNNPDSYVLHQSLANIYKYKLDDHLAASAEFAKSAKCPHAMTYLKRFAAYEMSYVPGREREAWQMLRKLYDMGEQERLPTLETRLKAMEEKLQLPPEQRVYSTPYEQMLRKIQDLGGQAPPPPAPETAPEASEEKLQLPAEQRVYKTP